MAAFDSTLIARAATALYDMQIGNGTMQEALDWINVADRDVDVLLNTLYVRDFGTMTDAAVASLIVGNVGITGAVAVAEAVSAVTGALAASAADEKGATVNSLLNVFSGLTANPVFGGFATAFNTQVRSAVAYSRDADSTDVSLSSTSNMVFTLTDLDANGVDVMRITGDQDVRVDFTNPANQVTGLDLDGDGLIEFNGSERSVTGRAANFEIVDAYSRNPLNHSDTANNFLGDIYFDGTSYHGTEGDGVNTDGNIFLGGLGIDTAFGGVGNDFLAGGGIAQGREGDVADGDSDELSGGRNADFFFGEFSQLDLTDGTSLYVDGGTTSDDSPAGVVQTDQDNDWFLPEGSDDDEPLYIQLAESQGDVDNDDGDFDFGDDDDAAIDFEEGTNVTTRSGESMDLDDIENIDASGNLYGFLNDMEDGDGNQLRIGGRATDDRYADGANAGSSNYGIGSSAQLYIDGSEVANIIIAGYDNDFIAGDGGNDLLFGGNLQQLFETVEDGATNLNLASITLDGLDHLFGGIGSDGLVFEADGGWYIGDVWTDGDADGLVDGGEVADTGTDTLWLTNYALGTNTALAGTTDDRLRFDLGSQTDLSDDDADAEPGFAGYGGANRALTADQTNYVSTAAIKATTIVSMNIIDASGLSTGVRGLDYFSAGTNETADSANDPAFSNRQDFAGYDGDLDLRGALNQDNNLYAGGGNDVIEGRGGDDAAAEAATTYDLTLQGGDGNDDFYFALDGDDSGDETNIIRRKVDANTDGWWDGSNAAGTVGTWGGDFGQNTVTPGESVLTIAITIGAEAVQISDAVNFISEIVTGVEEADGSFTEIVLNSAGIRAAQTYDELAAAINDEIEAEYADEADNIVASVDGFSVVITDEQGRTLADDIAQVAGAGVTANQKANTDSGNIFIFGEPIDAVSQDRIIFKSYEDRSDNEGVDDDAVTGSEVSLGTDAYAEDLVVSFGADGTRIAEDQEHVITFRNLATQDKVTVNVNGVTYTLTVGVALNGSLIDGEDTRHTPLETIQTNFLARLADYIDSFMDDDTAAGQVDATSTATTLTLTQVEYHDGEENVYMSTPVVTLSNDSRGEAPSVRFVDNDAETEVFLFNYDGRNGKLNDENVLFWGQESVNRSILETALTAGGEITGSDALVIDGGHGAGDDDLDDEDGNDIAHNLATDDGEIDWGAETEFQVENYAVHGDDYLIGGAGDDEIGGRTGDDRVRGSLGNDDLDGGADWYAVLEDGDSDYQLEYLNAFEAADRDRDGDVLDLQLVLQTESGHILIAPTDESPEETYEAYFDDTLIYHQADFTAGVTRFTITLNDYLGEGEELVFDEGGAGTVGVDANGDGTVEADNVSTFSNFENIRTVSGIGQAVAGTNGGQGRDTLNVQLLSDDADVGVLYDLTGAEGVANEIGFGDEPFVVASTGGDVILIEDTDFVDVDDDDEDDQVVDSFRQMIKVDGVENVIFGDGDDILLIDETEAAKDNDITGDDGYDEIFFLNDFADEDEEGDDEPTVTIHVGNAHVEGSSGSLDHVEMTEGRVGSVVATDTLRGIEELTLENNTAGGIREDDVINVENLAAGASVNYITGEIFSDTDGDYDFEDGVLQLTVNNLFEVEMVVADGEDAVIVADADIMSLNQRTDDSGEDDEDLTIDTWLNYDMLDERGDTPERLTIAELRAIDGGTDDTEDEDDIPEGINFGQFVFDLGQDTDVVDYSQTDDSITAVVDVNLDDNAQYILLDSDGEDGTFDDVDDEDGDRIDALIGVEEVVASQSESVLDFTASDMDVEITFQYLIDEDEELDADDGYSVTNTIRIADGDGDTIEGLTQFVERYTAEDGDIANATWNRIEGSDNDETVIYDGSEDLINQANVDHRYSDDELNLRGGDNRVSYSLLETSIEATITVNEYDPEDPLADQIAVEVDFFNGNGFLDLDGAGTHTITSHAADNEIAAGSLKLEATQDKEDVVGFTGGTGTVFILGQSPGVLTVDVGDAGAMVLTGFEFLLDDGESNDVYDFDDMDNVYGDLFLIDGGEDDTDTVEVGDSVLDVLDQDVEDFHGGVVDEDVVVSLEMINDFFAFDFDVLDITAMTENDLVIFGDDDNQDNVEDGVLNGEDDDYEDYSESGLADADNDGAADNDRDTDNDALRVGDLGLIDSLGFAGEDDANFDALWFTDASLGDGDSFVLDTTDVDFVLEDDTGDEYFTIYGAFDGDGNDLDTLNFSLVTADVTVTIDGDANMEIIGGSGDDVLTGSGGVDILEGGAGADDLDGSVIPAEGATLTVNIGGVGTTSGTEGGSGTVTIAGLTLTTDATIDSETDVGESADADQIGAVFEAVALATWEAALAAAGLDTAEAESLVSVDYDPLTNDLLFTFDTSVDGSTITAADLLAANTPANGGDAVLNIGSEAATDFVEQLDSLDIYVYGDSSDSTEDAMDQIFNFTVDGTDGVFTVDDVIDLSGLELEGGDLAVSGTEFDDYADASDDAADAFGFGFDVFVGGDGINTWVFVDADEDGLFEDSDLVIELVGIDATGIDDDNFFGAAILPLIP